MGGIYYHVSASLLPVSILPSLCWCCPAILFPSTYPINPTHINILVLILHHHLKRNLKQENSLLYLPVLLIISELFIPLCRQRFPSAIILFSSAWRTLKFFYRCRSAMMNFQLLNVWRHLFPLQFRKTSPLNSRLTALPFRILKTLRHWLRFVWFLTRSLLLFFLSICFLL